MTTKGNQTISIRPGVQILSVLKHLKYKSWFALAEFVDNSIQSYLTNRDRIEAVEGDQFQLRVDIEIDDTIPPRLIVRDNAAGIAEADYARAFRAAEVPLDRKGLSEFGMGMKSAACWFAPKWRVRSKALGEAQDGLVIMDVASIVVSGVETVDVVRSPGRINEHYTEVTLENLHHVPLGRTLGKIREHLGDIYRFFLRDKRLVLTLNGVAISFDDPEVYHGPRHSHPTGAAVTWRKSIDITTSKGVRMHGFAAIRKEGSASRAGFGLFRRDRLIQGGGDEGWKPVEIFGQPNSFRSQRVFGELFLDGVPVSHTKDGFLLEEYEEELIPLLRAALDAEPLPLLAQAEHLRVRVKAADLAEIAEAAARDTIAALDVGAADVLPALEAKSMVAVLSPDERTVPLGVPQSTGSPSLLARTESRNIALSDEEWRVVIEFTTDPAITDWLRVDESAVHSVREITVRFSLAHPFIERFSTPNETALEPLIRMACAIALGQVLARKSGVGKAGVVLTNINDLLRQVLAHD